MRLKADGEFCVTRDEAKDTPLWQLFLSILYLFDSIVPGIVLIDKLHNFEEGVCFPNNGYLGKRKKTFHLYNGCCKQKIFHQKLETYRFRLPLKN